MSYPLLEIAIPTFNRLNTVLECLQLLIKIRKEFPNLITISCSSNKIEANLKDFCLKNKIKYNEFEKNCGAHQNIKFLLSNTESKFCMILSDEDYLIPSLDRIKDFLIFLDNSSPRIGMVLCGVGNDAPEKHGFKYPSTYHGLQFSLKDYFFLNFFVPDYISGLTIRSDHINKSILDEAYEDNVDNAYAHKTLALCILEKAKLSVYTSEVVRIGNESSEGGESFSHRKKLNKNNLKNNKDLNPMVYGPIPRFKQFIFLDEIIKNRKLGIYTRFHGRLRNLYAFLRAIKDCHRDVENVARKDVRASILKYYKSLDVNKKKNLFIKLFIYFSKTSLIVFINYLLSNFFRLSRFFYLKRLLWKKK